MKSIIAAVITCAILFGVSFAASKYFMEMEEPTDEVAAASTEDAAEPSPEEEADDNAGRVEQMPVAHRPDKLMSVDAVMQMSQSVKDREAKLRAREQALEKEQQRVKLMYVDLETEQQELQDFSDAIDTKVKSLTQMTEEVRKMLADLETRKIELAKLEKEAGVDDESKQTELDNKVNDVKGWFAALQAQQASDYLKEFANNGKMEFAASLLHKMPDRQKSKILAAMNDPSLVDDLITALRTKPKTPK